ncbi:MAG: N-6 DNA methylase [Armatimonadota bacterium]|nr:N-6 DNA methylase [Armatimonadota bacterium]
MSEKVNDQALIALMRSEWASQVGKTTPDELRIAFENLLALKPEADRKSTGTFYTPSYIVDYIVSVTLAPILKNASARVSEIAARGETGVSLLIPYLSIFVLDAAAGSGRFLTSAARYIASAMAADSTLAEHQAHNNSQSDYFRLVVQNCIHGVDTDAAAIEAARLLLAFEAREVEDIEQILGEHLKVGNALLSNPIDGLVSAFEMPKHRDNDQPVFEWAKEFPHVFQRPSPGFDAVIGNPPWVSFSGRQAAKIDKDLREKLYTLWPSYKGWPSTHGIFLELAACLCRKEGRIGQIIPEQILDLARYRKTRERLFERARLVEPPLRVGEKAFSGVTSPSCIVILERSAQGKSEAINPVAVKELTPAGIKDCSTGRQLGDQIIGKMKVFPVLPARSFGDPGVHTGNCAKLLICDLATPGAEPIRTGRDVVRYFAGEPTLGVITQPEVPEGGYFRISDWRRYAEARLLIRQTAPYPIAARHTSPGYFRNSLLAFYSESADETDYMLALLNSRLIRFFHQHEYRDGRQKAFPQVKLYHLRSIPVPPLRPFTQPTDNIAPLDMNEAARVLEELTVCNGADRQAKIQWALRALARKMEELAHQVESLEFRVERGSASPSGSVLAASYQTNMETLDWLIDHLVYALYGLSEDERREVDEFMLRCL